MFVGASAQGLDLISFGFFTSFGSLSRKLSGFQFQQLTYAKQTYMHCQGKPGM